MAGPLRGPNARVGHYLFVSTYLTALSAGEPIWPRLRELGLSDHAIERRRWEMSRQGWMPPGILTREDAPLVRAMLRAKMREMRERVEAKERRAARVDYHHTSREERSQARRRAASERRVQASAQQQTSADAPVLDVFFS